MSQLTELQEEPPVLRHEVVTPPVVPTLETLTASLKSVDTATRTHAVRELRTFGTDAVKPLCKALRDRELGVRLAAAEALGEVGDERAIAPLVTALRDLFPGSSPRRARTVGLLAAITFPLSMICYAAMRLYEWGVSPHGIMAILGVALVLLVAGWSKIKPVVAFFAGAPGPTDEGPSLVYARALAHIAERCPAPELRKALPILREIAADGIQQSRRTRADSRKAARRIEALTARLDNLPVVASAPSMNVDSLPGASNGPSA